MLPRIGILQRHLPIHPVPLVRTTADNFGYEPPEPSEIHLAIDRNDLKAVEEILSSSVNSIDSAFNFETPLYYAIKYGKQDIAILLIEKGADVFSKQSCWIRPPGQGESILHLAVRKQNKEIVQLLMKKGCDPLKEGDGFNKETTPLALAKQTLDIELVDMLYANLCPISFCKNIEREFIRHSMRGLDYRPNLDKLHIEKMKSLHKSIQTRKNVLNEYLIALETRNLKETEYDSETINFDEIISFNEMYSCINESTENDLCSQMIKSRISFFDTLLEEIPEKIDEISSTRNRIYSFENGNLFLIPNLFPGIAPSVLKEENDGIEQISLRIDNEKRKYTFPFDHIMSQIASYLIPMNTYEDARIFNNTIENQSNPKKRKLGTDDFDILSSFSNKKSSK